MTFYIIGIGNKPAVFTAVQEHIIRDASVFSGGKRHYELVKNKLPEQHQWIYIQSPMSQVFDAYEKTEESIVVFASGNPLFYGFSNTLITKYPHAEIRTTPYFSAIQLLANATNTNSNQLETVSVHGRSWRDLDKALIQQKELIGVLTDAIKNPTIIAGRMLAFGYTNYDISIGEDIEGGAEQFYQLSVVETSRKTFHPLNCMLLQKRTHRMMDFGLLDSQFTGLSGRPNMITKMPIRLTSLHLLEVLKIDTLWDIGFCTGSISIEAKLKNPNLDIVAFEKRKECKAMMFENQKRFGTPGIQVVMGDFFEKDLTQFPAPDAIFIGGHGGRLEELFLKIASFLKAETTIVINAVQDNSVQLFRKGCQEIAYEVVIEHVMALDAHNPITLLKAKSINNQG